MHACNFYEANHVSQNKNNNTKAYFLIGPLGSMPANKFSALLSFKVKDRVHLFSQQRFSEYHALTALGPEGRTGNKSTSDSGPQEVHILVGKKGQ